MKTISETLKDGGINRWITPISEAEKTCEKHGIQYTEQVFKMFTRGCPKCAEEQAEAQKAADEQERKAKREEAFRLVIEKRIGQSGIPRRFAEKTVSGYAVAVGNESQKLIVDFIKAYATEFSGGKHSGRNIALLGNAGTGKTHLACAVARHVIKNCEGFARFVTVSELNRIVRESKSFSSETTESEVIKAFAGYDLLIIDEVGIQSGTEAESRALFDVFNERYQAIKPTIMISNLLPEGFVGAVGDRIADRIKEDGGAMLVFDWGSARE